MRYLLLILLLIPLVCAQELTLTKDIYQQKEMFQAEVFQENIKPQDITVLNPYNFKSNIGVNLLKLTSNHYYIYFEIPEINPGVYSLKVNQEQKQFQITQNKAKLSISTGAIKFTQESSPFSKITLTNNDIKSQIIDISPSSYYLTPSLDQIIIPPKSSKTFNIKLEKPSSNTLITLSINSYNIPVWYISDEEIPIEEETQKIEKIEADLIFYTSTNTIINYITKEIQESTPIIDSIYFRNKLEEPLNNLKLSLTGNLQDIMNLEFTELDSLEINGKKKLGITVNENRLLLEEEYSGDLQIITDKYSFKLPINFIVVEQAPEPESLTIEETTVKEPEITEPEINETKEEKDEETPSKTKYIYLTILIIILIIFSYIFIKKPKIKKQTFKDYIKKAGY